MSRSMPINKQIKGTSQLMVQVARFGEVETPSERRAALQLRDTWKERALLVTSRVKNG